MPLELLSWKNKIYGVKIYNCSDIFSSPCWQFPFTSSTKFEIRFSGLKGDWRSKISRCLSLCVLHYLHSGDTSAILKYSMKRFGKLGIWGTNYKNETEYFFKLYRVCSMWNDGVCKCITRLMKWYIDRVWNEKHVYCKYFGLFVIK